MGCSQHADSVVGSPAYFEALPSASQEQAGKGWLLGTTLQLFSCCYGNF